MSRRPWFVDMSDPMRVLEDDPRKTIICEIPCSSANAEARADARLISAAPDLASALERVINALDVVLRQKPLRDATETFAEARAALEKAGRI